MKRPQKYFDRRWLDGYSRVAAEYARPSWMVRESWLLPYARIFVRSRLHAIAGQTKPLTAYECGCVDALLDSVGC